MRPNELSEEPKGSPSLESITERSDADARGPSATPDFVIGIGASAGGLEALQAFFSHMDAESGASFVVVQHLSPDFKSMMDELLSKQTRMPVRTVTGPTALEADTIYLIPARNNLILRGGKLIIEEVTSERGLNAPINVFFQSLADSHGDRAIAVILSGTGTDGTAGVRAIRNKGGVVVVQDEQSARFDGMPHSAIATGLVDLVLRPEEMPDKILHYMGYRRAGGTERGTGLGHPADKDTLDEILVMVRDETTVDFSQYKLNTIVRRVERRMSLSHSTTLESYLDYLRSDAREVQTLGRELLISVTAFFRDTEAFEIIAREALPKIVRTADQDQSLRIWVPGCATGEEAYTVAILVHEALRDAGAAQSFKVFATDIDRDAIERAATGVFTAEHLSNVDADRIARYFTPRGEDFVIIPEIREKVIFAVHNLVKDPPFTRVDFISCRNLLIYFQPLLQLRALSRMQFALRPEGFMLLGPSETIGELASEFDVVNTRWKVFRKRKNARVPSPVELEQTGNPVTMPSAARIYREPVPMAARIDLEHAFRTSMETFVPPGLVLSEDLKLLHIFGNVERFFSFPTGVPDFDVLKLARGGLSITLATATHRVLKDRGEVTYREVQVDTTRGPERINLRVRHGEDPRTRRSYVLAFFEPSSVENRTSTGEEIDVDEQAALRIRDLEQELQYSRESLQATIEELETSNEELQSSNEELMAANEELQSTNEELNSVNEELYTVNAEYQKKIDELLELTSDMDNLLASTSIAVLFLDQEFRVRRFTDSVRHVVNVLPRDLGRPIQHLSRRFECNAFLDKLSEVSIDGAHLEEEIVNDEGAQFLMSVRPYREEGNVARGLVLTFVDISGMKRVEGALDDSRQQLAVALAASHAGMYDRRIPFADGVVHSEGWARLLGYSLEELPAAAEFERWLHAQIHPDDLEQVRARGLRRKAGDAEPQTVVLRMCRKDGSWIRVEDTCHAAETDGEGRVVRVIGVTVALESGAREEEGRGVA